MKRMRSDAKKAARNQAVVSELKTLSKKFAAASEPAKAKEIAHSLISHYDKAVSHGIIPRGRADRRKSRIAQHLAKLSKKK